MIFISTLDYSNCEVEIFRCCSLQKLEIFPLLLLAFEKSINIKYQIMYNPFLEVLFLFQPLVILIINWIFSYVAIFEKSINLKYKITYYPYKTLTLISTLN